MATVATGKKLLSEYRRLDARYNKSIERHLARYDDGTASRARTTTFNANSAWTAQRLCHLRDELTKMGIPIPQSTC